VINTVFASGGEKLTNTAESIGGPFSNEVKFFVGFYIYSLPILWSYSRLTAEKINAEAIFTDAKFFIYPDFHRRLTS
jgi:hypothetical protein